MKKMSIFAANQFLNDHLSTIRSVTVWASRMGWERTEFSRMYHKVYQITAKEKLKKEKLNLITRRLREHPYAKSYEVACDTGFKDEKALYDYLRYHCKGGTGAIRSSLKTDY